jgi:hypothetical protein
VKASEHIADVIDGRLVEVRDEIARLAAAKAALLGKTPVPNGHGIVMKIDGKALAQAVVRHAKAREKRAVVLKTLPPVPVATKKARRGRVQEKALNWIKANPGNPTTIIAKETGIERRQTYGIVKVLSREGAITGSHKGGWS